MANLVLPATVVERLRELRSRRSIPGWLALGIELFKLFKKLADYLTLGDFFWGFKENPRMRAVLSFLEGPWGTLAILLIGFGWLGYLVLRPERKKKQLTDDQAGTKDSALVDQSTVTNVQEKTTKALEQSQARTAELEGALNEANQKYSEVVTVKRIEQAAHAKERDNHTKARDNLTARLTDSETANRDLRTRLSVNEKRAATLQAELNRCMTPKIDFSPQRDFLSTATIGQDAHIAPMCTKIYLEVRSEIEMNDLRLFIENNIPLRAKGETEPYSRVFRIKPGERLAFHVATIVETGQAAFYTADGERHRLPDNFKITATGSGTMPRIKVGRFDIPRQDARGKYFRPIELILTEEPETGVVS